MYRPLLYLIGFIFFLSAPAAFSQEANNPLLYSYQAVQFSDMQVSHDPVTLILPGTAYAGGFSSYLDNPASAALFDDSFGTFGIAWRNVNETGRFLDNSVDFDRSQFGVSNAGFVYSFPTVRGSFVIGAGYSQHSFYNRALSISGRNNRSTMTDFFKIPGSIYEEIAFETWALDWADEEQTFLDSIFRIGFPPGNFPGITQEAEITERGYGGDYSAFFATEFLENLMLGASIGIRSGRHNYERIFLEIDEFNDYDGDFIETDHGGTDIDTILLNDKIRSDYVAFSARLGAIYQFTDNFSLGASYTFPSRLTVDEEFDAVITSTFDNGVVFEDDVLTEFSYKVTSPARLNLGAALKDLGGLTLSVSAEYVDYGKTRIDFDADLFEDERLENRFISDEYTQVWNLRGGAAIDITEEFTLRGGYGLRPSRFTNLDIDERLISGGIGFKVSENARFDLGVQYSMFDETAILYEYEDHNFQMQSELVDRDVNRLQVLGTIRISMQ